MSQHGNSTRKKRGLHISPQPNWMCFCKRMASTSTYLGKKSNTATAAKERELAREKIAARINACNPAGIKIMWQQLKMKYKNIIQSANRKKAEARTTGGGPAPPSLTNAEEMAQSLNTGRPTAEGILGGSSSKPVTPQDTSAFIKYIDSDGNICLLEPPVITEPQAVDNEDDETTSATERPTEVPLHLRLNSHNDSSTRSSSTTSTSGKGPTQSTITCSNGSPTTGIGMSGALGIV